MEQGDMRSNVPRPGIKTFVIFDTETTGLPSPGNNPQITELCFIALTRDELLTEQREPRVLNKLVLCFNPRKKISPEASFITGLYNDVLEDLESFSKQAPLICAFVKNLPQPACIIAHNGNGFDFPLLVSHLKLTNEEVPEGILCADSLEAFRTFDGLPPVPDFVLQKRAKAARLAVKSSGTLRQTPGDVHGKNETSQTVADSSVIGVTKSSYGGQDNCSDQQKSALDFPEASSCDVKSKQPKLSVQHTQIWNISDHTPCKTTLRRTKTHPLQMKSNADEDVLKVESRVRRQLFEGVSKADKEDSHPVVSHESQTSGEESAKCDSRVSENISELENKGIISLRSSGIENNETRTLIDTKNKSPENNSPISSRLNKKDGGKFPNWSQQHISYALQKIYARMFGREPKAAHTAEGDCLALLEIIYKQSSVFSFWCDENAVPLQSIGPLY